MRIAQKLCIAVLGAGLTLSGVAAASAAPLPASQRVNVTRAPLHKMLRTHRAVHRIAMTKAAHRHREVRALRRHHSATVRHEARKPL
jgi:hypothetical protein